MKQIFASTPVSIGDVIELPEAQAHHLFDVLRTTPDEIIRVIADGQAYAGHLLEKPLLRVDSPMESQMGSALPVTLCAALFKADKFEWMLQKAAELGVERIVPFISENTIIRIDAARFAKKKVRWQSILDQACRQSNRTSLVQLEDLCTLKDLAKWRSEKNICAYEKQNVSQHLACEIAGFDGSITFVLGPEGGLSAKEAEQLEAMGFALCSLGPRILRAETAACYVLSAADFVRSSSCCALEE